ncbi:MAG: proton-conducting transporter membrane subunit [Oligoflexus sp.]
MQKRNINLYGGLIVLWTHLLISCAMLLLTLKDSTYFVNIFSATIFDFEFKPALRFDPLSSPIYFMIALLGVAIGHFSIRHLDGEKRQAYFYQYLVLLITSVSGFVLSNDLIMFFLAWLFTSHFLHKLLLFYPNRPNAVSAAFKKQLVSRIGDLAIFSATVLIIYSYGTSNLTEIFELVKERGFYQSFEVFNIASVLIVLGALTKSAQLPFHFWLPETMETPAPVSAIMHAGIINAGGYLIIRFSPLLYLSTFANAVLIIVGAITATYAALIMMTQNNIKMKLAYSTISQMGIMIFSCGIGAYSIALFHILAHSFYKAHAFLSTGSLIEESKKISLKLRPVPNMALILSILFSFTLIATGSLIANGQYISLYTYAAVLGISMTQNWFMIRDQMIPRTKLFSIIAAILTLAISIYVIIEILVTNHLKLVIPGPTTTSLTTLNNTPIIYVSLAIFAGGLWLSGKLMTPQNDMIKYLYMHLWNGGYSRISTNFNFAKIFPSYPENRKYPMK